MHKTIINRFTANIFQTNWERTRSNSELRNYISGLHARVENVELDIAL